MTSTIKANGVHYTPKELAEFLAVLVVEHLPKRKRTIQLLDPACGDGGLLAALTLALPARSRRRLHLTGFDKDANAIRKAKSRLTDCGAALVTLETRDFLFSEPPPETYDAVIANPPYVRTQVLGAEKAQMLSRRFGLSGRVDLYQAFAKAIAEALKPEGVLGLLASNRFLTVKSGEALRRLLRTEFALRSIYDLGDTKLFEAAVLPAIVVAHKRSSDLIDADCEFHRIYHSRNPQAETAANYPTVLAAVRDRDANGPIATPQGNLFVEQGTLSRSAKLDDVFALSNPESDDWLQTVRSHSVCRFGDMAQIRVGIKTTADGVFVRDDWASLPKRMRPEAGLIHPLLTHREARRWRAKSSGKSKRVLYPHQVNPEGCRMPIRLVDFPKTAAYLILNENRLKSRRYVIESGRQWYEIWVPHNPAGWKHPKIVWPDISETPNFFFDDTEAIVQGDCYWLTLKEETNPDWLYLMLAVANSTLATKFYDVIFHNKLYAGRRRFMTQYVKEFPLPDLESKTGKKIVAFARQLVKSPDQPPVESRLNDLVWQSFGFGRNSTKNDRCPGG